MTQELDSINFAGEWTLTGFFEEDAGHRSGSYIRIFQNTSSCDADKLGEASGETLIITESGGDVRFDMRGGADVPWTSAEKEQGVLEPVIEDQSGRLRAVGGRLLTMERLVDGRWVSKYSDSDLDMDNVILTDGPDLVLLVTTIVDELYVTKYFYRFSRA